MRPVALPSSSAAEYALVRAQTQPLLSANLPSRVGLLQFKAPWRLEPLAIRVHRNHSFEHVASVAAPWFALWGRDPAFHYSGYDDSLSFGFDETAPADLELIWLDLQRYQDRFQEGALVDWLAGRLAALRARTGAPIVLAPISTQNSVQEKLPDATRPVPGTRVADLRPLAAQLGGRFYDERAARYSGTRLSDRACILVARELACHWAPAALRPRLKAVALDLDETLYAGILGEDGVAVRLTPAHGQLQRALVDLRGQGVFLALVSRNDEADVRQLFDQRTDFPLRWEHFSATAVGWRSKADGLRRVADALRVGLDALVFVDDNPGELASVAAELPMVATVHASADADETRRALEFRPGLWAWERSATDRLRVTDLAAEGDRARLAAEAADPRDYLRSLQVRLRLEVNPFPQLARLHELSQKTNQFNLNLSRLSEVELGQLLAAPDHRVASIELKDRLSDSGVIGFLAARRDGDELVVSELAISCRALGRGLEDLMIAETLRAVLAELPAKRTVVLYRTGPRNGPAREWLSRVAGQTLSAEGRVELHPFLDHIAAADYPVVCELVRHEPNRN